jgi:hypothetical protein
LNAFNSLILSRLLGFSSDQCAVIFAGPKTARNLTMRGLAILVGSTAFLFGAFQFTHHLLGKEWLLALAFSAFCGAMLLLVELYNLDEVLTTGRMSGRVWATRSTVIFVMVLASVFAAVGPMGTSIDGHLAGARKDSAHLLESDSRFKIQLESARAATEQATKDVVREKQLLARLNDLNAQHASASASARNERFGNVGTDGRKRIDGCGPACRGWEAEATRIDAERTAVSHELSAIAGATSRLASAQGALDKVNGQISAETDLLHGGATSRLGAMFDLLWVSGVAKVIVLFYLFLSILPELLTVNALTPAGGHQKVLLDLKNLEGVAMERAVLRLRMNLRDGLKRQPLTEGSSEHQGTQEKSITARPDRKEAQQREVA